MIPLRDTIPARRAPVMTWTLMAINIAVFLYMLVLPADALEVFAQQLVEKLLLRVAEPEQKRLVCLLEERKRSELVAFRCVKRRAAPP